MKIWQKGGIMLEVLVSVALFGVAIIGLLSLLGLSATLSTDSRYRTEAITLADELFGEMAAAPANTLSTNYADTTANFENWEKRVKALLPSGSAGIGFEDGTRKDTSGASISTFVTLTITWKAPSNTSTAEDAKGKFVTSTYFY